MTNCSDGTFACGFEQNSNYCAASNASKRFKLAATVGVPSTTSSATSSASAPPPSSTSSSSASSTATDSSSSSQPTESSSSGGLSSGAKAGIGIGVALGVLMMAALGFFTFRLYRKVSRMEGGAGKLETDQTEPARKEAPQEITQPPFTQPPAELPAGHLAHEADSRTRSELA